MGLRKTKVYRNQPNNFNEFKVSIRHTFRANTPEIMDNVQQKFIYRLRHCQDHHVLSNDDRLRQIYIYILYQRIERSFI